MAMGPTILMERYAVPVFRRRLGWRPNGPVRQCRAQTDSQTRYINTYFEMRIVPGLHCVSLVLLGRQAHRLGPQRRVP